MNLNNQVKQNLINQWDNMLSRGTMPLMEYQTGIDDYMLVNISMEYNARALWFTFNVDDNLSNNIRFSGDVKRINNWTYKVYADDYCDSLDVYLELIDYEIAEGFLLPNDLYYCEEA